MILAFFLQSDAPPPTPTASSGALLELLQNSGSVALAVLVVLAIASIYSWTLIFAKMSSFGKATKQSRRFIRTFRKATRLQEIAAITADYAPSPAEADLVNAAFQGINLGINLKETRSNSDTPNPVNTGV